MLVPAAWKSSALVLCSIVNTSLNKRDTGTLAARERNEKNLNSRSAVQESGQEETNRREKRS